MFSVGLGIDVEGGRRPRRLLAGNSSVHQVVAHGFSSAVLLQFVFGDQRQDAEGLRGEAVLSCRDCLAILARIRSSKVWPFLETAVIGSESIPVGKSTFLVELKVMLVVVFVCAFPHSNQRRPGVPTGKE